MMPVLDAVDAAHNHVEFVKVNCEAAPELAAAQGINAVPTFKLFPKDPYDQPAMIRGGMSRQPFETWLLENTPTDANVTPNLDNPDAPLPPVENPMQWRDRTNEPVIQTGPEPDEVGETPPPITIGVGSIESEATVMNDENANE